MNISKPFRKPYFAVLLTGLVFIISCDKQEENIKDNIPQVIIKEVNDETLINNFVGLQTSKVSSKSTKNIKFDFSNVYEVSISGNPESMLMANQTNFDERNNVNYAISAAITENGLSNLLIVKTSKISSNLYKIEYYNSDFQLLSTIELNSDDQSIQTTNNFQRKMDLALRQDDCGQATAECLVDAYSNHGWISVWAFVQTAFIPATAVALAAACAAKNCI